MGFQILLKVWHLMSVPKREQAPDAEGLGTHDTRFRDVSGLKYVVQKELDVLESARDKVLERVNSLNVSMKNPTAQDVERLVNCPRDSDNTTGPLCAHCELDDLFQVWGLFSCDTSLFVAS